MYIYYFFVVFVFRLIVTFLTYLVLLGPTRSRRGGAPPSAGREIDIDAEIERDIKIEVEIDIGIEVELGVEVDLDMGIDRLLPFLGCSIKSAMCHASWYCILCPYFRGNHWSNATCLTQASSKVANNAANSIAVLDK